MNNFVFGTVVGLSLIVSACETTSPVPLTRKLTTNIMAEIAETDVVVVPNGIGITASWTSAAGNQPGYVDYSYLAPPGTSPAAAGIGGVIGQMIAVAIVDAAPSARASRSANTINTDLDAEALNESLRNTIRAALQEESVVSFGEVSSENFGRKDPEPMDKIKVITTYTLAEDASAIRVQANVTYENDTLDYQTQYKFSSKIPKNEIGGPLYRNRFTYHSDSFEAPELTLELREQLVIAINSQFEEDISNLESDNDAKKIKKLTKVRDTSLKKAQDDKLSKTEKATLLIDKWRGRNSPILMSEIEKAHKYIARMLLMDINNTDVPQFEKVDPPKGSFFAPVVLREEEMIFSTDDESRINILTTSGYYAGSYTSAPANGAATYGNTATAIKK